MLSSIILVYMVAVVIHYGNTDPAPRKDSAEKQSRALQKKVPRHKRERSLVRRSAGLQHMASASGAVGRACSACTFLCEDVERVNCEICGCELPLLQSRRPSFQLQQPPSKAQRSEQPLPKAHRAKLICPWRMDDGKECQWSGRKCDLVAHQRSAKCHRIRRAIEARDKAAAGRVFSISAGQSNVPRRSSMESLTLPSLPPSQGSIDEASGEGESTHATTSTSGITATMTTQSTASWLHGILTTLVQSVRSVSTSIRAQPEAVADAVMLRLDEREREREQERAKDASMRARDQANSDLDKQLGECKQPEDFHKVRFKYNPEEQELYCDTCIRFRHLVHRSQICFYNNNRFAKVYFPTLCSEFFALFNAAIPHCSGCIPLHVWRSPPHCGN